MESLSPESRRWARDIHFWLPLMLVSWWLAWHFQDEFISDWDGFDYTSYTVEGLPSALGLGRSLFLGYNHLLWRLASRWLGTPPENAYLVLRYAVIAQAGPAIVAVYALYKELSGSQAAAFFGALIVASSPFYIIYSGRAMNEIPGLLMLASTLWLMLRALGSRRRGAAVLFLASAYLVGLSANVREFAIFYLPLIPLASWVIGRSWKKGLAGTLLAALGMASGIIFWTLYAPEKYWPAAIKWYAMSLQERRVHPVGPENFAFIADFMFNGSVAVTLVAPLALVWLLQRRELRLLLFFGLLGLLADLALVANHDLSVNARYVLTGLPGLAAACGWALAELVRMRGAWGWMLVAGLIVLTKGTYNEMARDLYNQHWAARESARYFDRIEDRPWNSAFIIGSRTPLINFYSASGARPHWKAIPTGAGWPDDRLGEEIDGLIAAGRLVYVDFDPEIWQAGRRKENRESAGLEMIKREYELEYLRDSIYRISRRKNPRGSLEE